ncbi:MAG: DUF362 domain-containing protein [Candidatus Bathyarchaeota archaeon]|nr:DUF362 domain-containing protein [Candidatus Bathyarchaeota archaeon]
MKSKVYYMDDRYHGLPSSIPAKAQQLFDHAKLNECFDKGDTVAIKCHMGEWNNSAYLRPILVRVIVDKVKEHGGKPFVTDTTTAPYYFYGTRSTADLHLETAARNGFTHESMGCPIIITDGMYGTDDIKIEIPDGVLLKEAYLANGIAEADAMIVVSHFKGHGSGVYGGSIKNVAIGCSSKRGKINVHLTHHHKVGWKTWGFDGDNCLGEECPDYVLCNNMCPVGAFKIEKDHATYDREACIGCFGHQRPLFRCDLWDREKYEDWRTWFLIAMGDAATGYVRHLGKENLGYITYAIDISPACDCVPGSDSPVIPNLGIFASRDMVAIDVAALDKSVEVPGIHGSVAEEKEVMNPGDEKFTGIVGMSQWITANTCSRLGSGSMDYELVEPLVSEDEAAFAHHLFTPETPSGYYLGKGLKKFGTWTPPGGFSYRDKPSVTIEELSKR